MSESATKENVVTESVVDNSTSGDEPCCSLHAESVVLVGDAFANGLCISSHDDRLNIQLRVKSE